MARMLPDLTEAQLAAICSAAEQNVYRALREQLGDGYLVLHSVKWIVRTPAGDVRDGETDFLICHRDAGLLVVEVKGGGISYNPANDAWFSVDRTGQRHPINDPYRQARAAKYSVLAKLRENASWPFGGARVGIGHAVLLPDVEDLYQLATPQSPREIIGGRRDLDRMAGWVEGVLGFWQRSSPGCVPLGTRGLRFVEDVFARPIEVLPLLSQHLADEERVRVRLTEQQARILSMLGGRRRAAIAGGAGTGKTLLAVEKARRLVREGFQTLLVCFNRPLADHLARVCVEVEGLHVMSFHQLCGVWIEKANAVGGRNLKQEAEQSYPGQDQFDVHLPVALAYAIDILTARFDAVVVDEGQDFREEYWLPVEMILSSPETSPLYVFYDQNQDLYQRASTFPVRDDPFVLTVNCRNTRVIHDLAYRYYRGEPTEPPPIRGLDVEALSAPTLASQAQRIEAKLTALLAVQKIRPDDITVLVADAAAKVACSRLLVKGTLPAKARWSQDGNDRTCGVLIETVNRFKGLESAVVLLWGLDGIDPKRNRESLYVGLSRAKSILYLVGQASICAELLADPHSCGVLPER